MSKSIEIVGKYEGERMRFENGDSCVIIGTIRSSGDFVTIKGEADDNDLNYGQTYRFYGVWSNYTNRRTGVVEKQFHFRTFVPHIPHDAKGIAEYLAVAGRGNGVGPSKAAKIVDMLGVDRVLDVCRDEPETIAELVDVPVHKVERFSRKLQEQKATESATIEVDRLLSGRGFAKTLTRRVIKTWGNEAAQQIATDPYSLMQFRGVGFKMADKLYINLGKDPAAIDRQALCMWYGMASDNDGHTWFPAKDVVKHLSRSIGGSKVDYRAAIIRGREYGQINESHYGAIATIRTGDDGSVVEDGGELWLAEGRNAAAERYVARSIADRMREQQPRYFTMYDSFESIEHRVLSHATCHRCRQQLTAPTVHVLDGKPYGPTCITRVDYANECEVYELRDWLESNPEVVRYIESLPRQIITLPEVSLWPEPSSLVRCSDHQREQYATASVGRICLLGGSPGTGKTFTLAEIIKAVHQSGRVGYPDIGVGAPTGKAAVRLTQALAESGVPIRARTTHSLLGVGDAEEHTGQWTFRHNENNPWQFKMMFFDEQSMTDIGLMSSIFKAIPPGCHAMFVGDVNQLPPVGNGAPFRDMIAAGLPYGELREIKRNSGGIVEACAAIRDEEKWTHRCTSGTNLVITKDPKPELQIERLFVELEQLADSGIDPVWDAQVLVAVNKSSKLSRAELNKILQDKLNPNQKVDGTPFRVGDKVVCLKNGFFLPAERIDMDDEDYDWSTSGEVYVANGELGVVQSIEPKTIIVELQNPARVVQVPRGKASDDSDDSETSSTGCAWDLGYALSVHKFQGSEQRFVFVMLDTYAGAKMVCDRSWIYTAISRGKERVVLIGQASTAEGFCRVQRINQRRTMLDKLILCEQFETELVGL